MMEEQGFIFILCMNTWHNLVSCIQSATTGIRNLSSVFFSSIFFQDAIIAEGNQL